MTLEQALALIAERAAKGGKQEESGKKAPKAPKAKAAKAEKANGAEKTSRRPQPKRKLPSRSPRQNAGKAKTKAKEPEWQANRTIEERQTTPTRARPRQGARA